MNRTRLFLSGGHGDLFPTTKAAAHLTPRWVLSREVPHAPGKGKVYASFTYPEHHNKYQLHTPEVHERKVVSLADSQQPGKLHNCSSQFPSANAVKLTLAGLKGDMSHKKKTNDTAMAKANISSKKAAEEFAMTRDFRPHVPPSPPVKKGYEPHADYFEASGYMEKRTAGCIKLFNDNKTGWTKEWFPQEVNPPAKPAPPEPKKHRFKTAEHGCNPVIEPLALAARFNSMAPIIPSCLASKASLSLMVLVIQNSLLVVMTRFSRNNVAPEENYYTSTLILNQESLKMLMCLVLFSYDEASRGADGEAAVVSPSSGSRQANDSGLMVAVTLTATPPSAQGDTNGGTTAVTPTEKATRFGNQRRRDQVLAGDARGSMTTDERRGDVLVHVIAESAEPSPSKRDAKRGGRRASLLPLLSLPMFMKRLRATIIKKDTILLLVPQALFTMQNFLIFVALSNLDAVSFQIWSQTKLLSAALFSVWMLHRHLSWMQWFSLALLTFGVLVTQLHNPAASAAAVTSALTGGTENDAFPVAVNTTTTTTTTTTDAPGGDDVRGNALIGITACVLSGLSSSYAGVYFEKVVKTTAPTLAIRNIQLSLFGIPLAFMTMMVMDVMPNWRAQSMCGQTVHYNIYAPPSLGWKHSAVAAGAAAGQNCPVKPFFFWQHYDVWLTWGLVAIHALGGLLVAIVVRYADNILKGFATGIAVIVSGAMSSAIWGYQPTLAFVLGGVLVTLSTIVFHKCELKR